MTIRRRPLIISVIGGGNPPTIALQHAREVGIELAKREVVVACGGLGGVMEAGCEGAKSAGGTTIGIMPGDDPKEANDFVDFPICTSFKYARNVIVVKTGRAVIAIDGSYGTMSEIAHALAENIPVIGLQTWSFMSNGNMDTSMIVAKNPVDAVNKAIDAANTRDQID